MLLPTSAETLSPHAGTSLRGNAAMAAASADREMTDGAAVSSARADLESSRRNRTDARTGHGSPREGVWVLAPQLMPLPTHAMGQACYLKQRRRAVGIDRKKRDQRHNVTRPPNPAKAPSDASRPRTAFAGQLRHLMLDEVMVLILGGERLSGQFSSAAQTLALDWVAAPAPFPSSTPHR